MKIKDNLETRSDFNAREIIIEGEITGETFINVHIALNYFENAIKLDPKQKEKPVIITINSEGGDIYAGLAIINSIKSRGFPVYTKCLGSAFSMAAWILAVGDHRMIDKNSFVMVHYGNYEDEDASNYMSRKKSLAHHTQLENVCWKILSTHTKHTKKWWENKCKDGDYYLTAREAKTRGLVDEII